MAVLWKETPLIHSSGISKRLGCDAYLKLENLHPSHSFKYRGISFFAQHAKSVHGPTVHLIIASGGNAGLAAACAADALSVRCTVFIPHGASPSTIKLLKDNGADVVVGGVSYLHALEAAKEAVRTEAKAVMVPAYDNHIVWEGHASMIKEVHERMTDKPDAIFCSVGGAGLLGGIILGCQSVGWDDVPIIAMETIGSDCFYHTIQLQRNPAHVLPPNVVEIEDQEHGLKLAFFNKFSSRASGSLGASSPAPGVVKMAMERPGGIKCVGIPDELAMKAGLLFTGCGNAGLAAAFVSNALSLRCTVFLPDGAAQATVEALKRHNADVVIGGQSYLYSLMAAKEAVKAEEKVVMIPSYDSPLIWEGHAPMIEEMHRRIDEKPDVIFCSVGGGGLLGGIIKGCQSVGWDDVPIITMETIGSNCFYHTIQLQRNPTHILPQDVVPIENEEDGLKLAFFEKFSSRASGSLGASSPAPGVVKMALGRAGGIKCVSIPDELGMKAGLLFTDEHKMLVELACSTTLAAAYVPSLFRKLVPPDAKKAVFVVCGGFKVSLGEMAEFKGIVEARQEKKWEVLCDGETLIVE
ncbi:hypothetical protein ONZ45_g7063 [Pleurotus djamor]|nr:hypothetical protein ONZ45_g7063 [Pleurotus djamor]